MGPEASINKPTYNPKGHAQNISDPVVHIGAAVEAWLDEFNHTAEDTRPQKNGKQSEATCSGEGEGQRSKGDEVYELVAAVWCRRRFV